MGSGWDFQRPFSRTAWMAGTNEIGRKRRWRSCCPWASQAEKGWPDRAVRRSISGLMGAPDNRNIIGEYITKVKSGQNLTADEHGSARISERKELSPQI